MVFAATQFADFVDFGLHFYLLLKVPAFKLPFNRQSTHLSRANVQFLGVKLDLWYNRNLVEILVKTFDFLRVNYGTDFPLANIDVEYVWQIQVY